MGRDGLTACGTDVVVAGQRLALAFSTRARTTYEWHYGGRLVEGFRTVCTADHQLMFVHMTGTCTLVYLTRNRRLACEHERRISSGGWKSSTAITYRKNSSSLCVFQNCRANQQMHPPWLISLWRPRNSSARVAREVILVTSGDNSPSRRRVFSLCRFTTRYL